MVGKVGESHAGHGVVQKKQLVLPEYKDVDNYEIYVSDKDGRCYCNI